MSQQIKQGGKRIKEGVPTQAAKDRPVITVITVVYNGEEYLEETIKSVIEQTYDNIEYLIIDGGSVDGTLEIIKRLITGSANLIKGFMMPLIRGSNYQLVRLLRLCMRMIYIAIITS